MASDEPTIAGQMGSPLCTLGEIVIARTVGAATSALALRSGWTAHVIDLGLPDGNGFDVVQAARRNGIHVPTLVIAGAALRPEVVNRVHDLGLEFICKPIRNERLSSFATRAMVDVLARDSLLDSTARAWEDRYGLTSAEAFVIRASLRGTPRDRLGALLGVAPSTLKTHVHNLLQKTGDLNLDSALQRALREVLGGLGVPRIAGVRDGAP